MATTAHGDSQYDIRNRADVNGRLRLPLSQATTKDKPAEEVFKNIQVFKGLPSSQLSQAMFFRRGSLGVTCSHCHVNVTDFGKDDNQNKQIARQMIQMVRELNQSKFGGAQAITCNGIVNLKRISRILPLDVGDCAFLSATNGGHFPGSALKLTIPSISFSTK
jgi:hypothetical protein